MKRLYMMLATVLFSLCAINVSAAEKEQKEAPKNHFKLYGFIRNYFIYDSRESISGTGDLFYYLPLDKKMNEDGTMDLNAHGSFRFLALTSRLGLDVSGYNVGNVHFGAKIEGDFYSGLSNSSNANAGVYFPGNTKISGTATARLRQAYATITWKDLPMGEDQKATVGLKIGQAWHPMASDMPHVFSLEAGAPFGPFSRTPQVTMDAGLGKNWVVSAAAIWQMQYNSQGPVGASPIYMKYGMTPEMYAGVAYKTKDFMVKAGVDVLSIKPRVYGTVAAPTEADPKAVKTVKVSDRKTSVLYYLYTQYTYKKFAVKAKTTYGQGGEHMNLMSGYAKVGENEDGSWNYASLRNSSSWLSLIYGKKWQGVLYLGYVKNLGLAEDLGHPLIHSTNADGGASEVYFCGNGFSNINQMYRINPQLIYNIGKLNIGIEYQWTSVQYGDYESVKRLDGNGQPINNKAGKQVVDKCLNGKALATSNLHWIGNHRVNMMVKYNF